MPFFYILYSNELDKFYLGSTRDTVEERLYKHKNKHKGFTSKAEDWIIVHKEYYEQYIDAHKRELEVKNWKSRKLIERLIKSV